MAAVLFLPGATTAPQDVSVLVTGLRSAQGKVLACITANPAMFPNCGKDPAGRHLAIAVPAGGTVSFEFGSLPSGHYAISLFHDENANGKLDKAIMLPREGFGFSRDAPVRFGPPSFAAAAFAVGDGPVRQSIRVRYMLGRSGSR